MEIVYFPGAFVLLAALIFGVLQYRYRVAQQHRPAGRS
jgi:hypothetical protein